MIGTFLAIPRTPLSSPSMAQYVRLVSSVALIFNLCAKLSVIIDTDAPLSTIGLMGFNLYLASIRAAVNCLGNISALNILPLGGGGNICRGGGLEVFCGGGWYDWGGCLCCGACQTYTDGGSV